METKLEPPNERKSGHAVAESVGALAAIDFARLSRLQAGAALEPERMAALMATQVQQLCRGDEVVAWQTAQGALEAYVPPSTHCMVSLCLSDVPNMLSWHRGRVFAGPLRAGQLLIAAPGQVAFCRTDAPSRFLHLAYSERALQRASARAAPSGAPLCLDAHGGIEDQPLRALMQAITLHLEVDAPPSASFVEAVAQAVGVHLAQRHQAVGATGCGGGLNAREQGLVMACLQDSLSTGAGAHDIAAELGMSAAALARRFKQSTGESLGDSLLRLRLDRAYELLQAGRLSATEIAHELGFADLPHFSRHFSRHFGVPPSRLRARPLRPQTAHA